MPFNPVFSFHFSSFGGCLYIKLMLRVDSLTLIKVLKGYFVKFLFCVDRILF